MPENVIRRRYARGLENFFSVYQPLATQWLFYDNADRAGPRLIAEGGRSDRGAVADPVTWEKIRAAHAPNSSE